MPGERSAIVKDREGLQASSFKWCDTETQSIEKLVESNAAVRPPGDNQMIPEERCVSERADSSSPFSLLL
jgi:hypothetical protein